MTPGDHIGAGVMIVAMLGVLGGTIAAVIEEFRR